MIIGAVEWAAVEAISTIAAVVAALGIALSPPILRFLRRPRLTGLVSSREPHTVAIASKTEINIAETVFVRVEIRNAGARTARNAWATVGRRWRVDLPPDPEWQGPPIPDDHDPAWKLVDSEPMALHWSSLPPVESRGTASRVDIARGHSEFAEVAVLQPRLNRLEVAVDDRRACRTDFVEHQAVARHRWEVIFGADDVEPRVAVVEFVIDGKNFINDVALSSAPPSAKDVRLLHLLRSDDALANRSA